MHATARPHYGQSAPRFEGADQDEATARAAFHQQIQHPMDAVVHVNVNRAGVVALDKGPRAGPSESVARLVVQSEISLRFDDDAGTFSPNQFRTDEFSRANQRIALEEGVRQERIFRHYREPLPAVTVRNKPAE